MMQTVKDISDSILYVENPQWQCSFGHGQPVKLGLVLEAVDLGRSGKSGEDSFSFVIDAYLIPQPEYLDEELLEEAKSEGALTREEQIRYIYECDGGVPVNIDALQPAKASMRLFQLRGGQQHQLSKIPERRRDRGAPLPGFGGGHALCPRLLCRLCSCAHRLH